MGEIIIRYVQLPRRVKALTATDENGDYNIYVNSLYSCDSQQKALRHELVHIDGDHFHRFSDAASDEKEAESHCGKSELCHSQRSEESHTHTGTTWRTTVKVRAANIVPRPDFEKMRIRAGLSPQQAAKLAGISHREYIKYERGLAPCPPLTAKAITAALMGYKKR